MQQKERKYNDNKAKGKIAKIYKTINTVSQTRQHEPKAGRCV